MDGDRGPAAGTRLRVLTYNILLGGRDRWAHLSAMLEAADAELVALQEVDTPEPCQEVATALGYQMVFGPANMARHQAVLSRWPVVEHRNHHHPRIFLRNSLEVTVAAPAGSAIPRVRLHTVHLPAAFHQRGRGEAERIQELRAVRRQAGRSPAVPHLIVGDFNALAPGDPVAASAFFDRISRWRRTGVLDAAGAIGPVPPLMERIARWRDGAVGRAEDPGAPDAAPAPPAPERSSDDELPESLRAGVPRLPWLLHPLLEAIPRGPGTDRVLASLLPREAIQSMLDAGYWDCGPTAAGGAPPYTCPTYEPAVRIDYVFADPGLAPAFEQASVLGRQGDLAETARRASDHFPVLAAFRLDRARAAPGARARPEGQSDMLDRPSPLGAPASPA